jgi:hypothetical protein
VFAPCPSLVSNKIIHRAKGECRFGWGKKKPKLKNPYNYLGNIIFIFFSNLKMRR